MASPTSKGISNSLARKSIAVPNFRQSDDSPGLSRKAKNRRRSTIVSSKLDDKGTASTSRRSKKRGSAVYDFTHLIDVMEPSVELNTQDSSEALSTMDMSKLSTGDIAQPSASQESDMKNDNIKEDSESDSMEGDEPEEAVDTFNMDASVMRMNEQRNYLLNLLSETKSQLESYELEKNGLEDASLEEKLANTHETDVCGVIDLSSVNMTEKSIPLVMQRVFPKTKKKYNQFILRNNGLTAEGARVFVDELLNITIQLKGLLVLNNPEIGDVGVEHFLRLLQARRSITLIVFYRCGLTDRSVRMLADALCPINGDCQPLLLEKIHLSFNQSITDNSMEALTQIIQQNKKLKLIGLQHCSLSESALQQLKQVLAKRKTKCKLLR